MLPGRVHGPSLEKRLFRYFARFWTGFSALCFGAGSVLCTIYKSPSPVLCVGCVFIVVKMLRTTRKVLVLVKSRLSLLLLSPVLSVLFPRRLCLAHGREDPVPCFLLRRLPCQRSGAVQGFSSAGRSVWCQEGPAPSFTHAGVPLSQHRVSKR